MMARPALVCRRVPVSAWLCGQCGGICQDMQKRDAVAAGHKLVCACASLPLSSLGDRLDLRSGRACPTQAAILLGCTCVSLLLISPEGGPGHAERELLGRRPARRPGAGVWRPAAAGTLRHARPPAGAGALAAPPAVLRGHGRHCQALASLSHAVHCWGAVPARLAGAKLAPATWPVSKYVCSKSHLKQCLLVQAHIRFRKTELQPAAQAQRGCAWHPCRWLGGGACCW